MASELEKLRVSREAQEICDAVTSQMTHNFTIDEMIEEYRWEMIFQQVGKQPTGKHISIYKPFVTCSEFIEMLLNANVECFDVNKGHNTDATLSDIPVGVTLSHDEDAIAVGGATWGNPEWCDNDGYNLFSMISNYNTFSFNPDEDKPKDPKKFAELIRTINTLLNNAGLNDNAFDGLTTFWGDEMAWKKFLNEHWKWGGKPFSPTDHWSDFEKFRNFLLDPKDSSILKPARDTKLPFPIILSSDDNTQLNSVSGNTRMTAISAGISQNYFKLPALVVYSKNTLPTLSENPHSRYYVEIHLDDILRRLKNEPKHLSSSISNEFWKKLAERGVEKNKTVARKICEASLHAVELLGNRSFFPIKNKTYATVVGSISVESLKNNIALALRGETGSSAADVPLSSPHGGGGGAADVPLSPPRGGGRRRRHTKRRKNKKNKTKKQGKNKRRTKRRRRRYKKLTRK